MTGLVYNLLKSPKELKPHPLNIEIYGEELPDSDLISSIKMNGILEPVVINEVAQIVSGHRRWLASKELGLERVPCRSVPFKDKEEEEVFLIESNRQRKKTPLQCLNEIKHLEPHIAKGLAEKQKEAGKESGVLGAESGVLGGRPKRGGENPLTHISAQGGSQKKTPKKKRAPTASDIAAKKQGISRDTSQKWKELDAAANSGDIEAQKQWDRINKGGITTNSGYNAWKKIVELEKKRAELAQNPVPPVIGKYKTIIIDPPWDVKKIVRDVRPNQSQFDYPTMSIDEIKKINLPTDEEAHLYLWTTQKFLPEAFEILKEWGFTYIFTMVWHKPGGYQPVGLPQYNCEFVLFGRRGPLQFEDTKSFNTCFNAPRKEHSRKPDEFYELVSRVSPSPRIDMFSREPRVGFEQWGNEVSKFKPMVEAIV